MAEGEIKLGRIKFYLSSKGYGFIQPDDGGPDIFYHISCLPLDSDEPEVGQRCSYEQRERKGRPIAASIRFANLPVRMVP